MSRYLQHDGMNLTYGIGVTPRRWGLELGIQVWFSMRHVSFNCRLGPLHTFIEWDWAYYPEEETTEEIDESN
mgnify:CR=1 FL=1